MVACLEVNNWWGSKFSCLNYSFLRVRNRAQMQKKKDTNGVSTAQGSMNQLETLCRDKPSRDTNRFTRIYQPELY